MICAPATAEWIVSRMLLCTTRETVGVAVGTGVGVACKPRVFCELPDPLGFALLLAPVPPLLPHPTARLIVRVNRRKRAVLLSVNGDLMALRFLAIDLVRRDPLHAKQLRTQCTFLSGSLR